jgi:hypothetical protein
VTRRPFAALAALLAVPLLSSCSADSKTVASSEDSSSLSSAAPRTTLARTSACKPVPAQAEQPGWFPADLPLPPGSFPVEDTESASPSPESDSDLGSDSAEATHRGFFVVKGTIDDFTAFVKTDWPAAGYSLGRGEAEPGEAEGGFRKGDFGGAYRIRDVYCDATMTELLITYGKGTAPG